MNLGFWVLRCPNNTHLIYFSSYPVNIHSTSEVTFKVTTFMYLFKIITCNKYFYKPWFVNITLIFIFIVYNIRILNMCGCFFFFFFPLRPGYILLLLWVSLGRGNLTPYKPIKNEWWRMDAFWIQLKKTSLKLDLSFIILSGLMPVFKKQQLSLVSKPRYHYRTP